MIWASLVPLALVLAAEKSDLPTPVFLHVFPVTVDARLPSGQATLSVRHGETAFGELTARGVARRAGDHLVRITTTHYPVSRDEPAPKHLACTFVVDCEEPPVAQAAALARSELGAKPHMRDVVRWVHGYIEKKSSARAFDVASVVARKREGDCTEHAVFLAAIARLNQIPSRVVTGLVIVELLGRTPLTFGHAWVEYYDEASWRVADAALDPSSSGTVEGTGRLAYLPIAVLDREDAGFRAGMLEGVQTIDVTGVTLPKVTPGKARTETTASKKKRPSR